MIRDHKFRSPFFISFASFVLLPHKAIDENLVYTHTLIMMLRKIDHVGFFVIYDLFIGCSF